MTITRFDPAPQGIELGAVEQQLRELWAAAQRGPDGEQQPMLKVQVHNLVVVADDAAELDLLHGPLAAVSAAHPGRTILICHTPDAPPDQITAQATIYCAKQRHGGQQVCGEEITLLASGEALEHVYTAVLALRIPGLPVIHWWPGDQEIDTHRYLHLLDTADELVLDSSGSLKIRRLVQLAALLDERPALVLHDLSWTRLTPWRELIASHYESALDTLAQIEQVTLRCTGSGAQSQAVLLLGWLSSRLSWEFAARPEAQSWSFRHAGRKITAQVQHLEEKTAPQVNEVVLDGGGAQLRLAVGDPGMLAIDHTLPGREPSHALARLPSQALADLLRDELTIAGRDRTFEESLRAAARLLR